jgi:hypothetical protein
MKTCSLGGFVLPTVFVLALCLAAFCPRPVFAAAITPGQARDAVGRWLAREAAPLGAALGRAVRDSTAHTNAVGDVVFHVVRLAGGGFVVTSADDGVAPVVAFSESDDLTASGRNPLWALLTRDLPRRQAAARARARPLGLAPEAGSSEAAWAALLAPGAAPLGLASVSDVRVAPFVASKWDQETVYYPNDPTLYNYYTPNNWPCGCVATAGAQLMRYHQWPQASVTPATYPCTVNGVAQNLTMQGGVYNWADMPLVPKDIRTTITLAQRQAIGKLTSDVGIAACMQYDADGSGTYSSLLHFRLTDRFGYASSRIIIDGSLGYLEEAVLTNLDAGFPVGIGISGNGGHFVVGDGYGYESGTLYVHLNMGWSGNNDAWYNLPTVDDTYYGFDVVDDIVYNIFPTNTGEFITGRVLDHTGGPVAGAAVTATNLTNGGVARHALAVTGASGVYAVRVPSPPTSGSQQNRQPTYRLTAVSGMLTAFATTNVVASVNTSVAPNGGSYSPGTGTVGNRWGVDVTLPEPPPPPPVTRITSFAPLGGGQFLLTWELLDPASQPVALDIEGRVSLAPGAAWNVEHTPVSPSALSATIAPSSNQFFRVKAE